MLGLAGVLEPEVERIEVLRLRLLPAAAARSAEACDTPARAAAEAGSRCDALMMLPAPVLGVLMLGPKLRDDAVDEERRWREGVG